jgi:hypothetical protein
MFDNQAGWQMDFLEGFLMGPLWSDTEYETRRHVGFHIFLGFLLSSAFVWFVIYPAQADHWLFVPVPIVIVLAVFLILATPFLCRIYYRFNFLIKFVILALLISKLILIYMAVFKLLLPTITLNLVTLPADLMLYVNDTIAEATGFFDQLGKATGMLLGIITGGILLVIRVALLLAGLIIIPILILIAITIVQRLVDLLVQKIILREAE